MHRINILFQGACSRWHSVLRREVHANHRPAIWGDMSEKEHTARHSVKMRQHLRHLSYISRRGGEANLLPPGLIDLVVVGTGAAGTSRSVFLDMTHFRYLFNCGEGTQRVAMEHKMRLSKLKNIFVTYKSWENIGGLLGMALSLGGIGLPEITIHGPPNVEKMLTMSKGFSPLTLKIDKREITEGPYEDSAMKIDFIPIYPRTSHTSDSLASGPDAKRTRLNKDEDMSVIYLCRPTPKQRSLDFNKAIELGVPRGPYLGKLKSGESITLDSGKVVTPDEVLSDPEKMTPFLVLEVPSEDYMDSLLDNTTLALLQGLGENEAPQLLVHFTPPEVLHLPRYQQWMQRFGPTTRHLFLNSGGSVISQFAPYEIQSRLNLVHPEIFPLLPHQASEVETLSEITRDQRLVEGRTCLKYAIREGGKVARGFYTENCLDVSPDSSTLDDLKDNDEFWKALAVTKEKLKEVNMSATNSAVYPEVTFLGTGSAMPNKIRNVSAIILHSRADQCILLDCGEGTYGQIKHHYGQKTDDIMRCLSAVFISHLHADHHMGLIGVIHGREKAYEAVKQVAPPLIILVANHFQKFIDCTEKEVLPLLGKIKFVPIEWFTKPEHHDEYGSLCRDVMDQLCLSEMKFARMRHPQFPYGVALRHKDGWKLAYSGDTMPCDAFVSIGEDCDLLIHEATMEDELIHEAELKKHSTTSQAIDIGIRMRAKFILLTHFSQRYAKIPRFSPNFTDKVGIAFDNMKVRPCDLPLLPLLLPALQALFSDDLQDMERRTEKHLLNRESKNLLVKQGQGQQKDQSRDEQDQKAPTPNT